MASATSDGLLGQSALKILVAGGFGVGKTTMVGTVSEIPPLRTEELLTEAGSGIDDLTGVDRKTTTTVALDFGRITINSELVLYLFGTPGQERFWFMWDELSNGALGAVVLADTRRLDHCFAAVDFFERRGIGFIVAVNECDGSYHYESDEIRAALDLKPDVPVVMCDARQCNSGTRVLIALVQHLLASTPGTPPAELYPSRWATLDVTEWSLHVSPGSLLHPELVRPDQPSAADARGPGGGRPGGTAARTRPRGRADRGGRRVRPQPGAGHGRAVLDGQLHRREPSVLRRSLRRWPSGRPAGAGGAA